MEAVKATQRLARRRPAETKAGTLGTVVGAVVALLGLNMTPLQVGALVTLLSLVPAGITWWRTR
jgi:hypothetical protein